MPPDWKVSHIVGQMGQVSQACQ